MCRQEVACNSSLSEHLFVWGCNFRYWSEAGDGCQKLSLRSECNETSYAFLQFNRLTPL